MAEKPDLTLLALAAELKARGAKGSAFAVWSIVADAGLSFKKACTPVSKTDPTSRVGALSFLAWVTQFLVPTLRQGNVIVMDNLSSHKRL